VHKLASLYEISYELLMEAAGYVQRKSIAAGEPKTLAGAALFSTERLTPEEVSADDLIAYSELSLSKGIDLTDLEPSLITAGRMFAGQVTRKLLGIFDFRDKTIYLNHNQRESRKNFVKLHETGHGVISWQEDLLGCLHDEDTVAPEIKEEFEREASYFASAGLFSLSASMRRPRSWSCRSGRRERSEKSSAAPRRRPFDDTLNVVRSDVPCSSFIRWRDAVASMLACATTSSLHLSRMSSAV
jgi:IrrE N-terminal-like domain